MEEWSHPIVADITQSNWGVRAFGVDLLVVRLVV
jgi:hypothetical protein